jgi:transketolase N-terminal domain/subunit
MLPRREEMRGRRFNVRPEFSPDPDRDRVVISHGHTAPGGYAALGRMGFFPMAGGRVRH